MPEMDNSFLTELQKLQELYKTNFDLVVQKVESHGENLQAQREELLEVKEELVEVVQLLKEVIAEKDVQIQRLIKSVAALTVVTNQLTERFNNPQR